MRSTCTASRPARGTPAARRSSARPRNGSGIPTGPGSSPSRTSATCSASMRTTCVAGCAPGRSGRSRAGARGADRTRGGRGGDRAGPPRLRPHGRTRPGRGRAGLRWRGRRRLLPREEDLPMSAPGTGMVEVRVRRGGPGAARAEMLLVPVAEGQAKTALGKLDRPLRAPLGRRARATGFRGKAEETLVHHGERAVALLGLGPAPVGLDAWRRAGARARQEAERERARRAGAYLGEAAAAAAAAFVEGFQLAGYRFAAYLSDAQGRPRVQALTLAGEGLGAGLEAPLAAVAAVVPEIFRARDLVNEPASVATPRFLAERVAALARDIRGLEAAAWTPSRIAREGLAGLLAVARGSREEPRFIRLRWAGP